MFDPASSYNVVNDTLSLREFSDYAEEFVVRPPYQRKSVWSRKKQQALLDSMFRRFYIPRIVIREVRIDGDQVVREVIDGQQRITTAQNFLADLLPLPRSLEDLHTGLVGKRFSELPSDLRRFADRLSYQADIVKGIENPRDPQHQSVAAEIFWRLQQGETLNYMEIAHARLSSLTRNFIVKYADDIDFDYEAYRPVDANPNKHRFFSVIHGRNDRMQHLALLARLLLFEAADGPAEIQDTKVAEFIDAHQHHDGVGNYSFENESVAQAALGNMNAFHETFKDDLLAGQGEGLRQFRIEYFILSVYLLLRHLRKLYVFQEDERALFHDFVIEFHERWRLRGESDNEVLNFADHRQQSGQDIELRHRVLRQLFFEYAARAEHEILTKDDRRAFNEAERISIYRRGNGLCQECLREGKPEAEARVPWREFEADHVDPHSRGGRTELDNAELLCGYHNASKGGRSAPVNVSP